MTNGADIALAAAGRVAATEMDDQVAKLSTALGNSGISATASVHAYDTTSWIPPGNGSSQLTALVDSLYIAHLHDTNASDVTVFVVPSLYNTMTNDIAGQARGYCTSAGKSIVIVSVYGMLLPGGEDLVAHEVGHLACARHDDTNSAAQGYSYRGGSKSAPVCFDTIDVTGPHKTTDTVPSRYDLGWGNTGSSTFSPPNAATIPFTLDAVEWCHQFAQTTTGQNGYGGAPWNYTSPKGVITGTYPNQVCTVTMVISAGPPPSYQTASVTNMGTGAFGTRAAFSCNVDHPRMFSNPNVTLPYLDAAGNTINVPAGDSTHNSVSQMATMVTQLVTNRSVQLLGQVKGIIATILHKAGLFD